MMKAFIFGFFSYVIKTIFSFAFRKPLVHGKIAGFFLLLSFSGIPVCLSLLSVVGLLSLSESPRRPRLFGACFCGLLSFSLGVSAALLASLMPALEQPESFTRESGLGFWAPSIPGRAQHAEQILDAQRSGER